MPQLQPPRLSEGKNLSRLVLMQAFVRLSTGGSAPAPAMLQTRCHQPVARLHAGPRALTSGHLSISSTCTTTTTTRSVQLGCALGLARAPQLLLSAFAHVTLAYKLHLRQPFVSMQREYVVKVLLKVVDQINMDDAVIVMQVCAGGMDGRERDSYGYLGYCCRALTRCWNQMVAFGGLQANALVLFVLVQSLAQSPLLSDGFPSCLLYRRRRTRLALR